MEFFCQKKKFDFFYNIYRCTTLIWKIFREVLRDFTGEL